MMDIPLILADWDEEKGPKIIKSIFPEASSNIDDSPEVLVTRCYISAQSIFARVEFSKINFNLPMVSIKRLAIVFFDIVMDESVRGDRRPFILVVFAPIETNYSFVEPIGEAVEPFLEEYKNERIPNLEKLQETISGILSGEVATPSMKPVPASAPSTAPRQIPVIEEKAPKRLAPSRIRVSVKSGGKSRIQDVSKEPQFINASTLSQKIRIGPWKQWEIDM
ncbi:MAG: hypothetical protein ACFFCS_11955, partial [Candidatus Hodarchaeota archaeon]